MKKLPLLLILLFSFAASSIAQTDTNTTVAQAPQRKVDTQIIVQQVIQQAEIKKDTCCYGATLYNDPPPGLIKEFNPLLLGTAILVIVIISFLVFIYASNMLKDAARDENGKPLPEHERPYSYSRSQLFWWTSIIISCLIIFLLKNWCLLYLNESCVILLGLGGLVHAGGRIMEQRDLSDPNVQVGKRKQDHKSGKSSFFNDILKDKSGLTIHRLQSFLFNVIFGLGFIIYFSIKAAEGGYPFYEFSTMQLTLLGVSSATYLTLKATENTGKKTNAGDTPVENTQKPE